MPRQKTSISAGTDELASATGSLARGLRLIELLVESPTPRGLSELAADAGVDTSSVHRLLQTLIERGYVVRDGEARKYMAGPKALGPYSMTHPLKELARDALPILTSVRNSTGETTAIVTFIGGQRLNTETVRGAHALVPYYDTWLRSPLHGSASGKVLLAALSSQERTALLGPGPYQAATPKTITDPRELERQLEEVNHRGYAVARDDAFAGMTAIAAPLTYSQRVVGCIAIIGRSDSIAPEAESDLGLALVNAAALLTHSAPSLRAVYYMFNSRSLVAV